jgi:hypothetical protein
MVKRAGPTTVLWQMGRSLGRIDYRAIYVGYTITSSLRYRFQLVSFVDM